LEEADSVFVGATVFSGLGISLLSLEGGIGVSCFAWMEDPPIVGLMVTKGGFSVTLGTSVFVGGGFRGAIGEIWSSFLLSTLTLVSKFSLVSVEGLSFRRTVIKKMNRATTAAVMRMLIVDKSNMICHTSARLKQLSI